MTKYLDETGLSHFWGNIKAKSVRAFATVADMQGAADLADGMVAHTNGFHTSGDGGAAYYTIGASDTANGMDVLALQNGLYATLVAGEAVQLEQLGIGSDASANADIFNYAILHYKNIDCGTDFTISKPVNISALSEDSSEVRTDMAVNLRCHVTSTCEEEYCFEVSHINRFHLNFDRITSAKGIFNLTASYVSGGSSFDTIVYLYFNDMVLNAGSGHSCINAVTTGDGWINEVYLNQTRFRSGVAITGARAQKDAPISNWHLNQVATEGVSQGIKILGDNWDIHNCRIFEAGSDLSTASDGFSVENFVIEGTYIGMTRYAFGANASGIVHGEKFVGANNGDFTYGTHAYAIIDGKWIRVGENPITLRAAAANSGTDTYDLALYTNAFSKPRMIEFANNAIRKLVIDPNYYFGVGKYNQILVSFPNLSGGSFVVEWTVDGTTYSYDVKNVVDTSKSNVGVLIDYSPHADKEVAFTPIGHMIRSYNYRTT